MQAAYSILRDSNPVSFMRVLGVGHCTLDQFAVVDRFPESDFKKEMQQFSMQGGGSAATAMVTLSRWGVSAGFIGKVGDDDRGRQIVRTIADEGVDTSHLIVEPGAISQLTFVVMESVSGRKQKYVTAGNVSPMAADDVDASWLDGIDLLLVDGTHLEAEMRLMRAAKEKGVKIVVDAAKIDPRMEEVVSYADYLVASERFGSQFAGVGDLESMCNVILEKGPSVVIVTLGNEGCCAMARDEGKLFRTDAFEVEDEVDNTGAGDVFHGGILYGVVNGWPLQKTVTFANIAAGLSCRGIGGRAAIPALDEVEGFLS